MFVCLPADFLCLLQSRAFQAGFKLYLAAGSTLGVTVLLMAYDPRIRSVVPMFGYTSVCLSMQERVEATTDKVKLCAVCAVTRFEVQLIQTVLVCGEPTLHCKSLLPVARELQLITWEAVLHYFIILADVAVCASCVVTGCCC